MGYGRSQSVRNGRFVQYHAIRGLHSSFSVPVLTALFPFTQKLAGSASCLNFENKQDNFLAVRLMAQLPLPSWIVMPSRVGAMPHPLDQKKQQERAGGRQQGITVQVGNAWKFDYLFEVEAEVALRLNFPSTTVRASLPTFTYSSLIVRETLSQRSQL